MKALLDTNILLDLFLARQPFAVEAVALWNANLQGSFSGYISEITPVNLFYIIRKIKSIREARQAVEESLLAFQICRIDDGVLFTAYSSALTDFEDAVQIASAQVEQMDAIVTRNLGDYTTSTMPVYSPTDFLKQLSNQP